MFPHLNSHVKTRKSRSPTKYRANHNSSFPHPASLNNSNSYSSPNSSFLNYASQQNASPQSSPINLEWVSNFAAQLSLIISTSEDVLLKLPLYDVIEFILLKSLSILTITENVDEFYELHPQLVQLLIIINNN